MISHWRIVSNCVILLLRKAPSPIVYPQKEFMGKPKREAMVTKLDVVAGKVISYVVSEVSQHYDDMDLADKRADEFLQRLRAPIVSILADMQEDISLHISDKLTKSNSIHIGYKTPGMSVTYLEPSRLAQWMNTEIARWSNI